MSARPQGPCLSSTAWVAGDRLTQLWPLEAALPTQRACAPEASRTLALGVPAFRVVVGYVGSWPEGLESPLAAGSH